jgi:hypothetical protein
MSIDILSNAAAEQAVADRSKVAECIKLSCRLEGNNIFLASSHFKEPNA